MDGLNNRHLFLTVLENGECETRVLACWEPSSWLADCCLLVFSHSRERIVSSYKGTNPSWEQHCHELITFQRSPSQNTIRLEVKISTYKIWRDSVQSITSVQSFIHVWLWNSMGCSMPGYPVHHQLLELTQTHIHQVSDDIQPSHPLSSHSPPAFNLSQYQGLLISQVFVSGGQIIGASASASVLPINIQGWFPLGWTGWISLQSKGLSRVFSNTIV